MNLAELAKASASLKKTNHSILLYGPPKSGKTKLAGTAAQIKEIKKIAWFDLENGVETLLHMGLTEGELAKITLFKLPDTRENPIGIETMLKAFSAKQPIPICNEHGRVNCVACKDPNQSSLFNLGSYGHEDLIVIDSGSQLGDSALNGACKGKPVDFKPGWDEYALQVKWLGDILSVIQQAHHTNFIVLTHEAVLEEDINGTKKDRIFPLMGTKNFCMKVAKYFGTVAYLHMKLGKHAAGSASTYRSDTLTGSRVNALLEKSASPSMRDILIEGGILVAVSKS